MKIIFSHYAIIDKEGFGRSFMLARELVALGNEVTFLTGQQAKKFMFPFIEEMRNGVKIIAFPDIVPNFMRRTGFGFLSVIGKFAYILGREYDIYFSDAGHRPSGGIPVLIKKVLVRKLVYICEWWDYFGKGGQFDSKTGLKKLTHGYYDLLFEIPEKKIANGIVCLSSGMYERAKRLNINKNNITVITGGADVESIPFYPTCEFREKYGISLSSFVFGYSGMNRGEIYDIIPFLNALKELKKDDFEIQWFTTGGYIAEKIKNEYGIGQELTEFGWVDYKNYPEILSCADCFILLQKEDLKSFTRWPNKAGDYFAAGRPIMLNPYGEIKKIFEMKREFFCPTKYCAEDISAVIKKIYVKRPDIKLRYSIREFAEKDFSWHAKAQQLLSFYKKVIKNEKCY